MILSGEVSGKMNRVCCEAVFLGNHPLKVVVITLRTTTFASRIWNKG